jgi:hypothetical protein
MPTHPIIGEDIRGVLARTQSLWPDLKGASVFITGATGFFGIWLSVSSLALPTRPTVLPQLNRQETESQPTERMNSVMLWSLAYFRPYLRKVSKPPLASTRFPAVNKILLSATNPLR